MHGSSSGWKKIRDFENLSVLSAFSAYNGIIDKMGAGDIPAPVSFER
jgi:hypothetical protein